MSDNIVMDPLKLGAMGAKQPLEQKQEKIQGLHDNQMRYYPVDKRGNVDEWGAVIKRQGEAWERQQRENKMLQKQQAQNYGQDLQIAMQNKKDQATVEGQKLAGERQQMLQQVQMKGFQEQADYQNYKQYQQRFGQQFKDNIDQKNSMNRQNQQNEKHFDAQMVERDRVAANEYYAQQKHHKDLSRNQLNQENAVVLEQHKLAEGLAKAEAARKVGTTIQALGDGYPDQRTKMEQADKLQERAYHNYLGSVGSPQRQKQLGEVANANTQQREAMARMEAAAGFVNEQQQRQRVENQQALLGQMQSNEQAKHYTKLSEAEHARHMVAKQMSQNAALNQGIAENRQEQMRRYKADLDAQSQEQAALKMYGNMTQAEKQLNKDELQAWKRYDQQQYALIPGISHAKGIAPAKQAREGSPAQKVSGANHARDVDRLGQQGFSHLRKSGNNQNGISASPYQSLQPHIAAAHIQANQYRRGDGGLLHGAVPLSSHGDLNQMGDMQHYANQQVEQIVRRDKPSLGAVRPDGSIATPVGRIGRNGSPNHPQQLQTADHSMGEYNSQVQTAPAQRNVGSSLGHAEDGRVYNQNNKRFSQINQANGGVGITYSNVVLGGGLHPDAKVQQGLYPTTSYHSQAVGGSPLKHALRDHSNRFVSNSSQANIGGNQYAYVKGVDFNSQQKYDYNILNGMAHGGGNAASGKLANLGVVAAPTHNLQSSPSGTLAQAGNNVLQR